jgi:hypothetical protein
LFDPQFGEGDTSRRVVDAVTGEVIAEAEPGGAFVPADWQQRC